MLIRKRSSFINKNWFSELRVSYVHHSSSPDSMTKVYQDEKVCGFNNLNNGLCYESVRTIC